MKYLQDYMEEAQTALFKQCSAFFAFSDNQLQEGLAEQNDKEQANYCSMGAGMVCLKSKAKELDEGLTKIYEDGVKQDIKENGKQNIIRRELANHEAFYTHDISSTIEALIGYEFTEQEINTVYRGHKLKNND